MKPEVFVILQPDFVVHGRLRVARDGKSVASECLSRAAGYADLVALEHALRLRDAGQVPRVTCIGEGSQATDEILFHGLAMGADRAFRLAANDDLYVDPQVAGQRIAAAIADFGGKLVFTGSGSDDGDRDVMPHRVAVELNAACFSDVMRFKLSGDEAQIERRIEKGHRQIWTANLPAVVALDPSSEVPRYVPVAARVLARQEQITSLESDRAEPAPLTALGKFIAPRIRPKRISSAQTNQSVEERMRATVAGGIGQKKSNTALSGPLEQVADQIVAFLEERGLLGGPE